MTALIKAILKAKKVVAHPADNIVKEVKEATKAKTKTKESHQNLLTPVNTTL